MHHKQEHAASSDRCRLHALAVKTSLRRSHQPPDRMDGLLSPLASRDDRHFLYLFQPLGCQLIHQQQVPQCILCPLAPMLL